MLYFKKIFILCVALFFMVSIQASELDELKKMADRKQWHEVIENLDLVTINDRRNEWRELLLSSAIAMISDPLETNVLKQLKMINRLYSYDDLKNNIEFNMIAAGTLVKLFPLCLHSQGDKYAACLLVMENIVNKAKLKEADAFTLGNIIRKQALFERVALPYFLHAVRQMEVIFVNHQKFGWLLCRVWGEVQIKSRRVLLVK